MEKNNVALTLNNGERVTSLYADTFFNDDYCDYTKPDDDDSKNAEDQSGDELAEDDWESPSDLLIGKVDLIPPFTSKITRGKTHVGILAIGDSILARERDRFLKYMNKLMLENDFAWNDILEREKEIVAKKVKEIYQEILVTKCKTLMNEINTFYESTLQDLENHLRKEVSSVVLSAHANIISDLNTEIKEKLEKERKILENILQKRYEDEVKKVELYYKLILDNEDYRNNKLINAAICERNDAIKAFYKQIEAENITSTMYVMCTERKKCKIKQFLLDNYQNAEIAEKRQKIKEKQAVLDAFRERKKPISEINKEWEEKIKKILQLFIKFVSFSLKLLPEQSTFLLDLEKMVVLQLNEIQKTPTKKSSILVEEEPNVLEFEKPEPKQPVCEKEPFVLIGDTSDSIPTPHGSRETLASHVELPMIRLQRQFVYAKCDKFDEVKALLEAKRCKCRDGPPKTPSQVSTASGPSTATKPPAEESESSYESLLVDDIEILPECPARNCQQWLKKDIFPDLNTYIDYTEDNFRRVKAILGKPPKKEATPELINPRDIIMEELPFSATKEKYHHVGTQYSSQEDVTRVMSCPCTEEFTEKSHESSNYLRDSPTTEMNKIMTRRKNSLHRVINANPNLLKMFTDESFDFVYTIK